MTKDHFSSLKKMNLTNNVTIFLQFLFNKWLNERPYCVNNIFILQSCFQFSVFILFSDVNEKNGKIGRPILLVYFVCTNNCCDSQKGAQFSIRQFLPSRQFGEIFQFGEFFVEWDFRCALVTFLRNFVISLFPKVIRSYCRISFVFWCFPYGVLRVDPKYPASILL